MTTATKNKSGIEVKNIALDHLHPAPWNESRPIDDGYKESLREKGQLVTAMVRPHPVNENDFEIVYGHRRAEALRTIGADTMRCEVRELSDEEAEELGAAENAQRAGLSWQQQCRLIEGYLARHDDDDAPARIGSALGISTSQVKRRARMLSNLSPSWQDAINTGALPAWTVDHFETLTIFDEKRQESIHKDLHYHLAGMSFATFRERIADMSQSLKAAPFDLEDVTLFAKAGACSGCDKRSDVQAELFGAVPGMVKKAASCLDASCYKRKATAHAKRKEEELLEKHPDAIKVATDWGVRGKDVIQKMNAEPAKKGDKGAVEAIFVGANGKRTFGYAKVKKERGEKPVDPAKAEAEARRQRAKALTLEKLSQLISDKSGELAFTSDSKAVLTQFCLVSGASVNADGKRIMDYKARPVTVEELWKAAAVYMLRELGGIKNRLNWGGSREDGPRIKLFAWMVDADLKALEKEAAAEVGGATVDAEDQAEDFAGDNDDADME